MGDTAKRRGKYGRVFLGVSAGLRTATGSGSGPGASRSLPWLLLICGRLIRPATLVKDTTAGSEPSQVISLSLRRAGAGLIAAAWVQVIICLVVARSGYPVEFLLIISPLFFVLTTAGMIMLLGSDRPAFWLVMLCGLFAAFSLTATWFLRGHYTGGLNAAEPLIGLGVFGAAMSGDQWSQLAGGALIGLHRGALVLAGTGLPSEHALLALIECGSLVAAIVGSALVRRYARRLDGVEATLRDQIVSDASDSAEHTAFREWSRLLHDAPVHRLWQVAEGVAARVAADPAQFRRGCAQDAELLRGTVIVVEPDQDLVQALDGLVAYFDSLGLRILLTTRDTADYPADSPVVTALKRAVEQSLVNVLQHSGQFEAEVDVSAPDGCVRIQVRDHGRGFADAPLGTGQLGTGKSIKGRMQDVGGDADVSGEAGPGTVVTLWWPA
jgi:hypothetical protein